MSVKPTAEKITEIGDKFLGMFFVLAKEETFLDCLLGLQYAFRNVFNFTQKLNIFSKEDLEEITSEICLASDKNMDENLKRIDEIIERLDASNWEEIDVTK